MFNFFLSQVIPKQITIHRTSGFDKMGEEKRQPDIKLEKRSNKQTGSQEEENTRRTKSNRKRKEGKKRH